MSQQQYKGWDVYYDPRTLDPSGPWSATSPDYSPDCDEDGFFAAANTYTSAATYDDLVAAIDDIIEEQEA